MNKIIVIGSSNMDLIAVVPHLPLPGETVIAKKYMQMHGGKGANQAVAARRAGADVLFITAVGADEYGRELVSSYANLGMNISFIKRSKLPTGIALINISEQSAENSITVVSGANNDLSYEDTIDALMKEKIDVLLLQNEIPQSTLWQVIQNKPKNSVLIYNPAPFIPVASSTYWQNIDVLILNQTECQQLLGLASSTIEEIISRLQKVPVAHIVVTLGAEGSLYVNNREFTHEHIPAFDVNVVDTTGAGDTFCGHLAASIDVVGTDHSAAIRRAMAASSIAIGAVGAQEAMPTRAEVEHFLKSS